MYARWIDESILKKTISCFQLKMLKIDNVILNFDEYFTVINKLFW